MSVYVQGIWKFKWRKFEWDFPSENMKKSSYELESGNTSFTKYSVAFDDFNEFLTEIQISTTCVVLDLIQIFRGILMVLNELWLRPWKIRIKSSTKYTLLSKKQCSTSRRGYVNHFYDQRGGGHCGRLLTSYFLRIFTKEADFWVLAVYCNTITPK